MLGRLARPYHRAMSEATAGVRAPARLRWLDAGIAFALFGLAMMYLDAVPAITDSGSVKRDFLGIVLIGLMTLPLVWRQSAPQIVLVVILTAWMVDRGLYYEDTVAMLGLVVAIHAIAALLPAHQAYIWGGVTLFVSTQWTLLGMAFSDTVHPVHVVTVILWTAIPFALGRAEALSRERLMALESAHRGAVRSNREATDAAVRTERARIARELHDVVAHEITVMTLQAEGARRALGDANPAVTEALQTIGSSGRKGLAEMNRMIGVLRDTSEAAGLPVDLKVTGSAHVPAGVELSAYRIVQESLTNALKHAGPGARASVVVEREANAVTITVEDDGRGVISDTIAQGGGHGLAGMRERVLALGGGIDLGPRPGGGFRVRAVLPSQDDTIIPVPRRASRTPAVPEASTPSTPSGKVTSS